MLLTSLQTHRGGRSVVFAISFSLEYYFEMIRRNMVTHSRGLAMDASCTSTTWPYLASEKPTI